MGTRGQARASYADVDDDDLFEATPRKARPLDEVRHAPPRRPPPARARRPEG